MAGKCQFGTLGAAAVGAKIRSFTDIVGTEAALQNAVATVGPIAVAVYVSESFVAYTNGRFIFFYVFELR